MDIRKIYKQFLKILFVLKEIGNAHQEMERSLHQLNKAMKQPE